MVNGTLNGSDTSTEKRGCILVQRSSISKEILRWNLDPDPKKAW